MAKKKRKSKGDGTPTFRWLNHGGKRKGAGRKAKRNSDGSRVEPSHAERPRFTKSRPLHVTLEMAEDVPNLRAVNLASVVSDAIGRANVRKAKRRDGWRVVHFCLLGTHIHAICESEGAGELANGMRSLNGTIAKALNKRLSRKGPVFAHRFHLHVLRTKTEVRNAVRYVLRNAERHGLHDAWPDWGGPGSLGLPRPDPLSTAAWFPYWAERELLIAPTQIPASVVRPAQSYLMKLAFENAPLSFAEPMGSASTRKVAKGAAKETSRDGSTTPMRVREVARAREVSTPLNQVPSRRPAVM